MMEELANWYILTLVITELQCETESPGGLVETLNCWTTPTEFLLLQVWVGPESLQKNARMEQQRNPKKQLEDKQQVDRT